ncbi:hypothetical protein MUB24_07430 [Lederbergia sp. NSJ-179]|uniref:hypothetical protein n=1 Tax=Lederbergia sp. NSJ-179 TaxID=2931402 RepID=UPI001FD5E903|nr:hypothetical protein [Lederbergia sp. NSJ-179]MCJ7840738.1 hypothetical protein [Lederbergia sp. NSJ-179]
MFNCAWCTKKIAENQPLYAINAKFKKDIDFSDREGEIVQVYLDSIQSRVPMIVTTADSEAKKHGQDGLFTVCSRKCGEKLKTALAKEINTFQTFQKISDME